MKVLEVREYGAPLALGERPRPSLGARDALVEVEVCALAVGEKLVQSGRRETYLGKPYPLPHVPGFQGAGRVVEVGEGADAALVGIPVAINGVLGCGECPHCRRGAQNRCAARALLGLEPGSQGCLAEYVSVPAQTLHPWPTELDITLAPFVSELATALHMVQRVGIRVGDVVLCIGAGQTGVMAIPLCRMLGADRIIAVATDTRRLDVAQLMGADELLLARDGVDVVSMVNDLTEGRGVDVALEMVGKPETIEQSIRAAGTMGRIGLLGIEGPIAIDFADYSSAVIAKELRLFGCFGKGDAEYGAVVELIRSGQLDITALPRQTFSLEEYEAAWEMASGVTRERVLVAMKDGGHVG